MRSPPPAVKDQYTVHPRENFVHVELEPGFEVSQITMRKLWADVLPICEKCNASRVLVECDGVTRSMHMIDACDQGDFLADLIRQPLRIAFCFYDHRPGGISHWFASVASSRITAVKFFSDLEQSLRGLRN